VTEAFGIQRVRWIAGRVVDATNNQMELTAVITALKELRGQNHKVTVVTDSEYVQRGITLYMPNWIANGWRNSKGKDVKNQDLWKSLGDALQSLGERNIDVEFEHIRGHNGDLVNEAVDAVCGIVVQDENHPSFATAVLMAGESYA
jgi:ribonuclease HI